MGGITLPLHLDPNDYSPEACAKRLAHYQRMAALNPKGFRQPRSMTRAKARSKVGNRDKRSKEKLYRIEAIAKLAQLSGKSTIPEAFRRLAENAAE